MGGRKADAALRRRAHPARQGAARRARRARHPGRQDVGRRLTTRHLLSAALAFHGGRRRLPHARALETFASRTRAQPRARYSCGL
eukprot:5654510-Pleurochrysis_carterae.AAC.1